MTEVVQPQGVKKTFFFLYFKMRVSGTFLICQSVAVNQDKGTLCSTFIRVRVDPSLCIQRTGSQKGYQRGNEERREAVGLFFPPFTSFPFFAFLSALSPYPPVTTLTAISSQNVPFRRPHQTTLSPLPALPQQAHVTQTANQTRTRTTAQTLCCLRSSLSSP